jgi:hypothetical protein
LADLIVAGPFKEYTMHNRDHPEEITAPYGILDQRQLAVLKTRQDAAIAESSLDEADAFPHNREASVAPLRWCLGSSKNAFGFLRNERSASPEFP